MPRQENVDAVRFQQGSCANLGSPFYAGLLAEASANCEDGQPFWAVLDAFDGDPNSSLAALRLLGALHHLVLANRAPDLAAHYPRDGKPGDPVAAWREANRIIDKERSFVQARLNDEVQTNEVRRSAALLPGFMVVQERARLPMRLAELGSSAGLNLGWDRYHYSLGPHTWGPVDAALKLKASWRGGAPPMQPIEIASRRGCDISPLDIKNTEDRLRLKSFVWPDQFERIALLESALHAAGDIDAQIEACSAADFVARILAEPVAGQVSVVFHSIMWLYVSQAERERIEADLAAAGRRASATHPLAWLRMEFMDDKRAALWLDYWPGDLRREMLATCHYHGTSIEWLAS